MSLNLQISWKVIIPLPNNEYNNILFNQKTGKSFVKNIGGINTLNFEPTVLEPTNVFHGALSKVKIKNNIIGKKFPYKINVLNSHLQNASVNFSIHLFSESLIILTVNLTNISVANNIDLLDIQNLEKHKELNNLVRNICGLIKTNNIQRIYEASQPKTYPSLLIGYKKTSSFNINNNKAVEVLTRHKNVANDIVTSVINKNQIHQINHNSFLIDKQGILTISEHGKIIDSGTKKKHKNTWNMFELAIAIQYLLKQQNIFLNQEEEKCILNLVNNPEGIFIDSTTSKLTWNLLVEQFSLIEMQPSSKCIYCKEKIELNAKKCKHCGEEQKKFNINKTMIAVSLFLGLIISIIAIYTFWEKVEKTSIFKFKLIKVNPTNLNILVSNESDKPLVIKSGFLTNYVTDGPTISFKIPLVNPLYIKPHDSLLTTVYPYGGMPVSIKGNFLDNRKTIECRLSLIYSRLEKTDTYKSEVFSCIPNTEIKKLLSEMLTKPRSE